VTQRAVATDDGASAFANASHVVLAVAAAGLVAISGRHRPGRLLRRATKGSTEKATSPGLLSRLVTKIRMATGGRRKELEQDLLEAQELTTQAETRAETLQTLLEAELKEERDIRDELQKQIASLQEAYSTISDNLELEVEESQARVNSVMKAVDEGTAQLRASKIEERALLKRLEEAEKIERRMEEDQKKLIEQVSLASAKEKTLGFVIQQRENELSESAAENESLRANLLEAVTQQEKMTSYSKSQDAKYRTQLKELQSRDEQLQWRLVSLQRQESKEEALSIELTRSHARNKYLDAELQAAEQQLEALLKEKSTKGAAKGNRAGKGKGKGARSRPKAAPN